MVSCAAYLRRPDRVKRKQMFGFAETKVRRSRERCANAFIASAPKVTHFIAAEPEHRRRL
jgi:hypothetical protein